MDFEWDVNYLDCIKDSPKFRKNINLSFSKIVEFQDVITEISDSFSQSIKSGIAFSCHYQIFCSKIEKLNKLYSEKDDFQSDLNRIIKIFVEFKEHFKSLMESFHVIQKDFKLFMDHFKEIESSKKLFQKSSDNMDSCQQKCAAIPKSKSQECADIDKQCTISRREFTQYSLNYITNIDKFDIYKQSLFLRASGGIVANKWKYYSQGNEFMIKLQPWIDHLTSSKRKYDHLYEEKSNEIKSVMDHFSNNKIKIAHKSSVIEGYLSKCPRKSWQKWQRRWYRVDNNRLLSCKRNDDTLATVEDDLRICTAREYCDTERRFCLELIGLDHVVILQADDESGQKRWIECFQGGMSAHMDNDALQNSDSRRSIGNVTMRQLVKSSVDPEGNIGGNIRDNIANNTSDNTGGNTISNTNNISSNNTNYKQNNNSEARKSNLLRHILLTVPGNDKCCDCNDDKPRWASSSLGITLCTECSGAHRSLGVHISKVRSLTLDNWEPEMLCVMFMLGNSIVNRIYESDKQAISLAASKGVVKPVSNSEMNFRKLWIQSKWEKKEFVQSNIRELLSDVEKYIRQHMTMFSNCLQDGYPFTSVNDLMRYGLEIHCLPLMMLALALNGSSNGDVSNDNYNNDNNYYNNTTDNTTTNNDDDDDQFIPLHLAASNDFWPGCEFLILNGAKIDIVDRNNQTALHKACQNENVLVVWLLLKRGARQNIRDSNDNEVLQIAMNTTNANTVTLLRLQMLNENTKEANLGSGGDETVNDVFRDFTNRAFDQIEEWFFSESGRFHRMNSSKSLTNNVLI